MSMTLHVSREGSDDEVTFADIIEDQRHLFAEPGELSLPHLPNTSIEKKVDADFLNKFEDDFDEGDMKR